MLIPVGQLFDTCAEDMKDFMSVWDVLCQKEIFGTIWEANGYLCVDIEIEDRETERKLKTVLGGIYEISKFQKGRLLFRKKKYLTLVDFQSLNHLDSYLMKK